MTLKEVVYVLQARLRGTQYEPASDKVYSWYRRSRVGQFWYFVYLIVRLIQLTLNLPVIHRINIRSIKLPRSKVILQIGALAIIVLVLFFQGKKLMRAPLVEKENPMEYYDDLIRDTLALNRLETLMGSLNGILATGSNGPRDSMSFTPQRKAELVAIVALSGDCSFDYLEINEDDITASVYHAISGDYPAKKNAWWHAWDGDIELILAGKTDAFAPVMDKKLLAKTIKELEILDYFKSQLPIKTKKQKGKKATKKVEPKVVTTKPKVRKPVFKPTATPSHAKKEMKKGRKRSSKAVENMKKIQAVAALAQKASRAHKDPKKWMPVSVFLAQWCLESGYGDSHLNWNYFGETCGSLPKHSCPHALKCKGASDHGNWRYFRVYENRYAGLMSHLAFLHRGPYKTCPWGNTTDYKGWIRALKRCGYAEDKKYVQKLINIVEVYDLTQYDS